MAFSAVFLLMTPGKLKSDSLLVASLLVVALTSLPAQALGPVIEHPRLEVTKQPSPFRFALLCVFLLIVMASFLIFVAARTVVPLFGSIVVAPLLYWGIDQRLSKAESP